MLGLDQLLLCESKVLLGIMRVLARHGEPVVELIYLMPRGERLELQSLMTLPELLCVEGVEWLLL